MSQEPHPGTELGRRCQALRDAAAAIVSKIDQAASMEPPRGRLTSKHYRQAVRDLYDSASFRRLRAEVAAFDGLIKHVDPAAEFTAAAQDLAREGDYSLDD